MRVQVDQKNTNMFQTRTIMMRATIIRIIIIIRIIRKAITILGSETPASAPGEVRTSEAHGGTGYTKTFLADEAPLRRFAPSRRLVFFGEGANFPRGFRGKLDQLNPKNLKTYKTYKTSGDGWEAPRNSHHASANGSPCYGSAVHGSFSTGPPPFCWYWYFKGRNPSALGTLILTTTHSLQGDQKETKGWGLPHFRLMNWTRQILAFLGTQTHTHTQHDHSWGGGLRDEKGLQHLSTSFRRPQDSCAPRTTLLASQDVRQLGCSTIVLLEILGLRC